MCRRLPLWSEVQISTDQATSVAQGRKQSGVFVVSCDYLYHFVTCALADLRGVPCAYFCWRSGLHFEAASLGPSFAVYCSLLFLWILVRSGLSPVHVTGLLPLSTVWLPCLVGARSMTRSCDLPVCSRGPCKYSGDFSHSTSQPFFCSQHRAADLPKWPRKIHHLRILFLLTADFPR